MSYVGLSLDEKFSKMLLDIYSELTGVSVAFFTAGDGGGIYSDTNWPEFCQEFSKIIGLEKCVMDYSVTEIKGPYQCYAGLWCYSQSVTVDGTEVGTFVVGYRRIRGREKESKKVLEKRLSEHEVDDKDSNRLRVLLENVDVVDEDAFNIRLLERLSVIKQYITMEHRRATIFKKEAVSLAHEFLLPIQSVIADAENLFNVAEERSEFKEIAEDILKTVTKLSFIAENMRGVMLEERDEFGYEFHNIDVYPIIQDTIKLFRKEAKKKGIIINDPVVEGNIPVSSIQMSESHIRLVFFNLIHNAVKYSFAATEQSKGYISVVCMPGKNFYCVEISNCGIGIEPEEISRGLIFEDGYRGILTRDRSRTGSGIGLCSVKRIIEAHNGYTKVESKQVGDDPITGLYKTTIKVCIPFYQPMRSSHGNKKDIMDRR